MRVRVARVKFQLLHLMAAEAGFVDHAPDSLTENFFRIAREHVFGGRGLETADPTGVFTIKFVIPLVASEHYFVRVQNNDEIAGICMTGVSRLMFASNHSCQNSSEAADHLVFRVDNVPLRRIRAFWLKEMRAHLLRLIRLLLQHRRLELQDTSGEVNGIFNLTHCVNYANSGLQRKDRFHEL